ncbi:hypothetical protein PCL_00029 [Purpureocillium lilacinum]|uniref:Uncharacterized protein n=1 Tax=Purpureocillium lilacinum TaxID=33203 RepID=A0A2U3DP80_PURLI|nr:hypothetical protein PCL_00029 [Purpureocillium lilacinum]
MGSRLRQPSASSHARDPAVANLIPARVNSARGSFSLNIRSTLGQLERVASQRDIWASPIAKRSMVPPLDRPTKIDSVKLMPLLGRLTGQRAVSNIEDALCVTGRYDAPIGRFSPISPQRITVASTSTGGAFFIDYESRGSDRRLRSSRQTPESLKCSRDALNTQMAPRLVCSYCLARLPPDPESSAP